MRIHNLYTDASGQSHFRDIEVEWVEERRGSKLSRRWPAGFLHPRTREAGEKPAEPITSQNGARGANIASRRLIE